MLVTALAVVTMLQSTPHHSNYGGGFALWWVFIRCNILFLKLFTHLVWWRHHDITSLANWRCAYVIAIASDTSGGGLNRTRGSIIVFLTVFPNLMTFLVYPTQLPIRSQNCYPCNGVSYLSYRTSSTTSQACQFSWLAGQSSGLRDSYSFRLL